MSDDPHSRAACPLNLSLSKNPSVRRPFGPQKRSIWPSAEQASLSLPFGACSPLSKCFSSISYAISRMVFSQNLRKVPIESRTHPPSNLSNSPGAWNLARTDRSAPACSFATRRACTIVKLSKAIALSTMFHNVLPIHAVPCKPP